MELAGFYFLYYGAIGVTLPFLPGYLHGQLGLSATQVGVLLALNPLVSLFAPPRWGARADRTGRPDRLLRALSLGAALGFLPMVFLRDFAPIAATLACHGLFASALVPLVDTLTLRRVRADGGSYARIRLFGSLGFVIVSAAFGAWGGLHPLAPVAAPVALMLLYAAWSWTIRAPAPVPVAPKDRGGAWTLLRDRPLALGLAACALHWIACAPFNGIFALHVASLSLSPAVVGGSAALGVLAEVAVMIWHPTWGRWLSPAAALGVAFLGSALRWVLTATVVNPVGLVGVSLLHGLTFGVFYVAAVTHVGRRVPETHRALGQGLFVSITFGLGGLLGFGLSGAGYDALGGPRLFLCAAWVEAMAALCVAAAARARGAPVQEGVVA